MPRRTVHRSRSYDPWNSYEVSTSNSDARPSEASVIPQEATDHGIFISAPMPSQNQERLKIWPTRSSYDRRMSEAQDIFERDETAKPILRSPYERSLRASDALYYGHITNENFNNNMTPDQERFMARQDELERRTRTGWAGIAQNASFQALDAANWLQLNSYKYPRVQRHGKRLRLLERMSFLDALTGSKRRDLVNWWVGKFGPINTPPPSPVRKPNWFKRKLAHVRGTKYYKARQAKRWEREEAQEMSLSKRMDRDLYGGNPNNRFSWLRKRTPSGSRRLRDHEL